MVSKSGLLVAVDWIGSAIMGVNLDKVKYLKLAEKKGLRNANLTEIDVIGNPIKSGYRKF